MKGEKMQPEPVIEVEEDDKVKQFREKFKLLPGGKGPKEPETGIWLRDIPEGYMFHVCQKGQIPAMFCQVLKHFEKTTILFDVLNQVKFVVHTSRFSNSHEKLEVIPIHPKEDGWSEEQEEYEDGKPDQLHGNEEGSSRVVADPRDDKA